MDPTDEAWDLVGVLTKSVKEDLEDEDEEVKAEVKKVSFTPAGKKKLFITKSGAFIKFEYVHDQKIIKKIENYFTLRAKLIMGGMKSLKCCVLDKKNNRIIVPRFGIFEILNKKFKLDDYYPVCQLESGKDVNFKWLGKLTPNQSLIADHIMSNYYTDRRVSYGSAGVIVNLEAGQGKSYLAAYMMSLIKKKTAIILHTTALIEQWSKVLINAFGSKVSIGYYYGKKKIDGDVVILIVDSASSDVFKLGNVEIPAIKFYNQFGLIIFDECHVYSNKTALKCLKSAQAPYMLGLSATPDEHPDKYDRAVWWSIGPVLTTNTLAGYSSTSEDFKAVVHRVMYYGPPSHTRIIVNKFTEMTSIAETVNMLCDDEARSHLAVDCIVKGLEKGLFMFVFADRREYLSHLRDLLLASKSIEGEIVDNDDDFVRIVGGAKSEDLEKAEINSKVIFTTYQYMGTGKSVIKMNGLVLATPRKSKMKQYINRIFRLGSDPTVVRHIYDICDMKIKATTQWSTRHAYYKSKGYTIEQTKVKYEDIDVSTTNVSTTVGVNSDGEEDSDGEVNSEPSDTITVTHRKLDSKTITSIADKILQSLKS